jgi:hypothetical protein
MTRSAPPSFFVSLIYVIHQMMLFTWLALLGYPQGVLRLYRTCISTRLGIRLGILESMVLGWIDVSICPARMYRDHCFRMASCFLA